MIPRDATKNINGRNIIMQESVTKENTEGFVDDEASESSRAQDRKDTPESTGKAQWDEHAVMLIRLRDLGDCLSEYEFRDWVYILEDEAFGMILKCHESMTVNEMLCLASKEQHRTALSFINSMRLYAKPNDFSGDEAERIKADGERAKALLKSGRMTFGRDHDFWWHRKHPRMAAAQSPNSESELDSIDATESTEPGGNTMTDIVTINHEGSSEQHHIGPDPYTDSSESTNNTNSEPQTTKSGPRCFCCDEAADTFVELGSGDGWRYSMPTNGNNVIMPVCDACLGQLNQVIDAINTELEEDPDDLFCEKRPVPDGVERMRDRSTSICFRCDNRDDTLVKLGIDESGRYGLPTEANVVTRPVCKHCMSQFNGILGKESARIACVARTGKLKRQGDCLSREEFEITISQGIFDESIFSQRTGLLMFMLASEEQELAIEQISRLHTLIDSLHNLDRFENLDPDTYDVSRVIVSGMAARIRVRDGLIDFAEKSHDWEELTGLDLLGVTSV
jgi:hypothetical protein